MPGRVSADGTSPYDATVDQLLERSGTKVHYNWLTYHKHAGGESSKEAMTNHLSSMGVVAALMAAFFLAGVQAPPLREGDVFDRTDPQQQVYAVAASCAFVLNLGVVVLVVAFYAYASLYAPEEFHLFLNDYAIFSATLPPTLCVIASLAGIVAVVLRIRIVWGDPAWWIFAAAAAFVFVTAALLNMFLERSLHKLRTHQYRKEE